MRDLIIPASVPATKISEYRANYKLATANSGRLLLFAGDQKVEHLNDDFYGPRIAPEDANPEHFFKIASASQGVVLATHLGLISQYGQQYPNIPYVVKVNGKTNLTTNEEKNSSLPWWTVSQVVQFKKQSKLKVVGIGYTVYLGSKYESKMLAEASQIIYDAHQHGLIAIIWMYPRGKGIKEEDIHTIAGGAGVAACLDADFVKVKYPYGLKNQKEAAEKFKEVVLAAGRTKIICVGGNMRQVKELISTTNRQIDICGTSGLAIGRNLHQRPLEKAISLVKDLSQAIHKKPNTKKLTRFLGIF